MLAINQKIEELVDTMDEAMVDSGDDVTYAQIEESIRNHVGVRFIKDLTPSEEKPSIIDYLNLFFLDFVLIRIYESIHKY